jgi:uncharacterized protein YkwD
LLQGVGLTFPTYVANVLGLVLSLSFTTPALASPVAGHESNLFPLLPHRDSQARMSTLQDASSFALQTEELINHFRASQGIAPLAGHEALRFAAQAHNAVMDQTRDLCHACPGEGSLTDQLWEAGYPEDPWSAGQVLGFNYASPDALVNGWLSSASHRRSLLDPQFAYVGCALLPSSWGLLETCQLTSEGE